ncbi:unnamed protein product, partial [Nesidiocoris tenuis]
MDQQPHPPPAEPPPLSQERDKSIRRQIGLMLLGTMSDYNDLMEQTYNAKIEKLREELKSEIEEGTSRIVSKFEEILAKVDLNAPITEIVKSFENFGANRYYATAVASTKIIPSTSANNEKSCGSYLRHEFLTKVPKFYRADNILKQDKDFERWKSLTVNNLAANSCVFLLRENNQVLPGEEEYAGRLIAPVTNAVMAYLKSNLGEQYQTFGDTAQTPKELIDKLTQVTKPLNGTTFNDIHQEWQRIRFDPNNEDLQRYNNRFLVKVNDMKATNGYILTEAMLRTQYLESIAVQMPDFYDYFLSEFNQNKNADLLEVQKSANDYWSKMLRRKVREQEDKQYQLEAQKKGTATEKRTATHTALISRKKPRFSVESNAPVHEKQMKPTDACHTCGLYGHWKSNCSLNERVCYNCKGRGHISSECHISPTQETIGARARAENRRTVSCSRKSFSKSYSNRGRSVKESTNKPQERHTETLMSRDRHRQSRLRSISPGENMHTSHWDKRRHLSTPRKEKRESKKRQLSGSRVYSSRSRSSSYNPTAALAARRSNSSSSGISLYVD